MIIYLLQKTIFIISLIGLLASAACQPNKESVSNDSDTVITFQREGGFAGMNREWLIFPDGRIVGPGGQEMQAPAEEVSALLTKSAALESMPLEKSYAPDTPCCDRFTYTIIVKTGKHETRISTTDGADHPAEVSSLLTGIQALILTSESVD